MNDSTYRRRTHTVKIRANDQELVELRARVPDGLSLSAWLRGLATGQPRQPKPGPKRRHSDPRDPALVRQVARLGNNLNQIARWANTYKGGADAVQVLAHLEAISREIDSLSYCPTKSSSTAAAADAD